MRAHVTYTDPAVHTVWLVFTDADGDRHSKILTDTDPAHAARIVQAVNHPVHSGNFPAVLAAVSARRPA